MPSNYQGAKVNWH